MIIEVPGYISLDGEKIATNINTVFDTTNKIVRIKCGVPKLGGGEEELDISMEVSKPKLSLHTFYLRFRGIENIRKIPFDVILDYTLFKGKWDVRIGIGNEELQYTGISSWVEAQKIILKNVIGIVQKQI